MYSLDLGRGEDNSKTLNIEIKKKEEEETIRDEEYNK